MIPYIHTPFGDISSFTMMIAVAALAMLFALHIVLKKSEDRENEEVFILNKIVISGFIGFVFSGIADALFKIRQNGGFVLKGITFYGGLIGAVVCMYLLLKFSKKKTCYTVKEWFDNLTIPLIVFHFFGRIGCFLGGCCYGKNTDSVFGVSFPDNAEAGIIHNGAKCYPTQLFEAFSLVLIFVLVLFVQSKFEIYLCGYAVSRFIIEFFRGDNRGTYLLGLSPAQVISILILVAIICRFLLLAADKLK